MSGGRDTIDGGEGDDTIYFGNYAGAVTVDLRIVDWQSFAPGQSIQLVSVENVVGSAYADRLTGDGAANALAGGGGDDILDGGAGGDTAVISGGRLSLSRVFATLEDLAAATTPVASMAYQFFTGKIRARPGSTSWSRRPDPIPTI